MGAESAVVHADRLDDARARTARPSGSPAPSAPRELVRETWRAFEEFNLSPPLALEALFVRLRRELGAIPVLAVATLVLGSPTVRGLPTHSYGASGRSARTQQEDRWPQYRR